MNRKLPSLLLGAALAGLVLVPGTLVAQDAAKPTAPAAGGPKLEIGETTFNAGSVAKGDPVQHDFEVKNTGNADLLILEVKPACGCTAPDWTKVIAPGGTGKISLKVDTSRFKGPISKSANVTTNDPQQPTLHLVMNADVKTFVDILPRDVVSIRQYRGEEQKQELTIQSNEETAFKVNDVQVTGEGVKHEIAKVDDKSYKLTVWVDKDAPIGNASGTIKLLTNSAKEPEVTVNVRGQVLGQISVNPSTLYFRVDGAGSQVMASANDVNVRERGEADAPVVAKVAKGEVMKLVEEAGDWSRVELASGNVGWVSKKLVSAAPATDSKQSKVLNVTHREASEFKITGTSVEGQSLDAKAVQVETEAVEDGQSYRVTVTYSGGLEKGNYTGSLILKTTDKSEPEVKVPLYIVIT